MVKAQKKNTAPIKRKTVQDVADDLVTWIAEGKTLREFCRQPGMPNWQRVYEYMDIDEEFAGRIAGARDIGADVIAQECLDICDNAANDWMERLGKDGQPIGWMLNGDHVQRSKLRIETRLKLLSKWNPKKYGDRVGIDHSGAMEISHISKMTMSELEQLARDKAATLFGTDGDDAA